MSISNYSELKTAIANWLDDTNLSSRIVEFVTLAEGRLTRDLSQSRQSWSNTSLTGVVDSRSVALPSDYVEGQSLFLVLSGEYIELRQFINGTEELRTSSGQPCAWSINGTNVDFDRPCDSAYTFSFRYRAKFSLSDGSPTNWLLTAYPDIYLSACMAEAYKFRQSPGGADLVTWNTAYKQGI